MGDWMIGKEWQMLVPRPLDASRLDYITGWPNEVQDFLPRLLITLQPIYILRAPPRIPALILL